MPEAVREPTDARRAARGLWTEGWSRARRRPRTSFALAWIVVLAFLAVFAPLIASGHPWRCRAIGEDGTPGAWSSPLLAHLRTSDWLLLIGAVAGAAMVAPRTARASRAARTGMLIAAAAQAAAITVIASWVQAWANAPEANDQVRAIERSRAFIPAASGIIAAAVSLVFLLVPSTRSMRGRLVLAGVTGVIAGAVVAGTWRPPLESFPYREQVAAGRAEAVFTIIPFSPGQRTSGLAARPPGSFAGAETRGSPADVGPSTPRFLLGSDPLGQDVLSQMIHACRLSISIGLVSTSIAVLIGVTIGALMGYFGGWVDLLLSRIVEMFMAVPVLFLLIVAASVLPRNTYVMMAIIGCFTWTGAARYVRAEFLRLRELEYVAAARAIGTPTRTLLFRHMLPNGITPVLVDSSFAVAAAVLIEATLSYLGLGAEGQPSWGRLLAGATGAAGDFVWWLALFPGAAIFLTVLSYNMLGEAMREAMDPKGGAEEL